MHDPSTIQTLVSNSPANPIPNAKPAPHSWLGLGAAFAGLAIGGVAAILLVSQFFGGRPHDLRPITEGAAKATEKALREYGPLELDEAARTEHASGGVLYNEYQFEAKVPSGTEIESLARYLDGAVRAYDEQLAIVGVKNDAEGAQMDLARGPLTFATIRLAYLPPDPHRANDDHAPPAHAEEDDADHADPPIHLGEVEPHEAPDAFGNHAVDVSTLSAPLQEVARELAPFVVNPNESAPPLPETPHPSVDETATPKATPHEATPPPAPSGRPRLALVIDDGGYGGAFVETILGLGPKLTVAVLPYTPHGTELADRASELGFEVLLHMPMENIDPKLYPHQGQLMTTMAEDEIRKLTLEALAQVPGAVGVNNHMGSKFTADPKAMALFMDVIHGKNLFFLDSRTTPDSRAFEMAEVFGVRTAARDRFIDNDSEPEKVRARLEEVIGIALEKGRAIAIGHFRENTAAVLAEVVPGIEARGVDLVHVSELLE